MDVYGNKVAKNNLKEGPDEVLSIWNHNIKIEMQCQPYLDRVASDGLRGEVGAEEKGTFIRRSGAGDRPDAQPAGEGGMPM